MKHAPLFGGLAALVAATGSATAQTPAVQMPSALSLATLSGGATSVTTNGKLALGDANSQIWYAASGGCTANAAFRATISGTTMTVASVLSGALADNETILGAAPGTYIVSGSGTSWTVSPSQTLPNPQSGTTPVFLTAGGDLVSQVPSSDGFCWNANLPAGATPPSPANPTATAGSTAINGTATTYMRSDAAPAVATATPSTLGLVKPDGTIITDTAGAISVAQGSSSTFGVLKCGTNTTCSGGTISTAAAPTSFVTTNTSWTTTIAAGVSSPAETSSGWWAYQPVANGNYLITVDGRVGVTSGTGVGVPIVINGPTVGSGAIAPATCAKARVGGLNYLSGYTWVGAEIDTNAQIRFYLSGSGIANATLNGDAATNWTSVTFDFQCTYLSVAHP